MIELLCGLLGVFVVLAILLDIFLAAVVPRRAPNLGRYTRVSGIIVPRLWRLWRTLGLRFQSAERRETFLGTYGSLVVILLLAVWVAGLILGYGLILFGLRTELRPPPETLGTAMYYAGVSLLTLGFGDIVAMEAPARFVSLVAAANGLGLFALVITLFFTLYGSFQRREVPVVVLQAGAGSPPSGVTLLETYGLGGIVDDLPRVFGDWQSWAAEVLDTHLAYPVLGYFRSSHDNDSWISSLGAVMDAATLVLTTIDGGPKGWAKLSLAVGNHCFEDLVYAFHLEGQVDGDVGVERAEFETARLRLAAAGFALRDADQSWDSFARLRAEYAGRVNALAQYWATPPALWIGDRSPLKYPRAHSAERPQPAAAIRTSSE